MKVKRLKYKLLLGAVAMSMLTAIAYMLAVSIVINQQHLEQSRTVLHKASEVIEGDLDERNRRLLDASHQLATQKNLGSTVWYLVQYAQTDLDHETLFNTYKQLARDTYKIGSVANLSKVAIYSASGHLISFALFNKNSKQVGFVERSPSTMFKVATLKDGEDLDRNNLQMMNSVAGISLEFSGQLQQNENVHYAVVDGLLSIESYVPIMGEAFNPTTGDSEIKQLGLVVMAQSLDQPFVDRLSRLTDTSLNVFTSQGFSNGKLPAYQNPDWGSKQVGGGATTLVKTFNEVTIKGQGYHQALIPLYANKKFVGAISSLYSNEIAQKNTLVMIKTLGLITVASLFLLFPLAWYFASSISNPLTLLSRIFRDLTEGQHADELNEDFHLLENEKKRGDELGDLTKSFIDMNEAVNQKIKQINEINASLEDKIKQRTDELRLANEELTNQAMYDVLTQLPNRRLLMDRLHLAQLVSARSHRYCALLFLDMDNFKVLNDTVGHDCGDLLLIEVAERIQACVRDVDMVARLGGDEFVVLLNELDADKVESTQQARIVAEKIRDTLSCLYRLRSEAHHGGIIEHRCSASIGVALFEGNKDNQLNILKWADIAMYQAKEAGRNQIRFYDSNA